jgi:two-component system capsular synthesis sensor histidine kinase RcsC
LEATIPGQAARPSPVNPTAVQRPGREAKGIRILVAEDHPVNRKLMRDQLEALGYEADFTHNGMEALEKLSQQAYDLVLTDLSMPELDGYGLATRLRKRGVTVPIIAITAHTTEEAHHQCVAAGIDDVLTKPYSVAELDTAILALVHDKIRISSPASSQGKPTGGEKSLFPPAFYEAMRDACEKSMSIMSNALESGNLETVQAELHSMKGAFAMAQKSDVAASCTEMENLVREKDLVAARAAFSPLNNLISVALEQCH